ncbi:MAG: PDZ domain-containing protein [Actinomycetota bacterium]|nr:PDZ domain-containing protein [Actinomycetota bacterium]
MEDRIGMPPPPPPGVEPVRGPRTLRWVIVLGLLLALVIGSNWIPLPIFYAYLPGPVRDVEERVEVGDAKTYSSEGKLYLTTVNVDIDVTLRDWIEAIFDPERTVVLKDDVTGGGSLEDLQREQEIQMQESKQHAEEVALAALGIAEPTGNGARVSGTVDGAPADGVIRRGDVIVSVDGEKVSTTCDVGRAVDAHDIGEEVTFALRRAGEVETVILETARNPQDHNAPYVGVFMKEIDYKFKPGFEVDFETGEIAGPSAGLMFALALYDRLTPDDLTGGRDIAGTGTVACDGGVGPIGGIEQKVAGAEAHGAVIFLAPAGNAAAAEEVADDIEVVSVSTFDDAVRYLEDLQ